MVALLGWPFHLALLAPYKQYRRCHLLQLKSCICQQPDTEWDIGCKFRHLQSYRDLEIKNVIIELNYIAHVRMTFYAFTSISFVKQLNCVNRNYCSITQGYGHSYQHLCRQNRTPATIAGYKHGQGSLAANNVTWSVRIRPHLDINQTEGAQISRLWFHSDGILEVQNFISYCNSAKTQPIKSYLYLEFHISSIIPLNHIFPFHA